ncbi:MAG: sigma-70 family RNA polymerase sigma factor [Mobilitalea sp.]
MTKRTNDYELAVRRQFSSFCKKVIHNAAYDYKMTHIDKRNLMEIFMDDLYEEDREYLKTMDIYDSDYEHFEVAGMNLKAQFKDERLLHAINNLSARQKEVLLLSVVEEETDTRIAEILNLDRSTVSEHRRKALAQLKKYLKENIDE